MVHVANENNWFMYFPARNASRNHFSQIHISMASNLYRKNAHDFLAEEICERVYSEDLYRSSILLVHRDSIINSNNYVYWYHDKIAKFDMIAEWDMNIKEFSP